MQDVAVSERNQDADMDHGTMQVCAASQGRQKWVTARAVYPKARLPDRSGANARQTFAFTITLVLREPLPPLLAMSKAGMTLKKQ